MFRGPPLKTIELDAAAGVEGYTFSLEKKSLRE
jgi:hypothetical protein